MTDVDIFSNPLTMHVYALGALALVALQIEFVALVNRFAPKRLPASIVRRAL